MATLHQYYETDFSNAVRMHVKLSVVDAEIEATVLYDFSGYMSYFACYVHGNQRDYNFFIRLVESLDYGKTPMILDGKITLPSARA